MLGDWSGMDIQKAIEYIRGSLVSELNEILNFQRFDQTSVSQHK